MISLDELLLQVNDFIGTSGTTLYTTDRRIAAINRAIRYILNLYDIPEYTVLTTLSTTSGQVNLPSDCLRPQKLYKQPQQEYRLLDFDVFEYNYQLSYNIRWNTSTDLNIIKVYPAETTTFSFWYVQIPTPLTDGGTDEARFKIQWSEAIAAKATEFLLRGSRSQASAVDMKNLADEYIGNAWQSERSMLQGKEEQRLQSVYEKNSLLQIGNAFYDNYTIDTMSGDGITWIQINSDISGQINYGYITIGSSLQSILLPEEANLGDSIEIIRTGTGNWRVTQGSQQQIQLGDQNTTLGTGGYIESSAIGDSIKLICTQTNTRWAAEPGWVGNITYV